MLCDGVVHTMLLPILLSTKCISPRDCHTELLPYLDAFTILNEPSQEITNKITCAPSEDSDQPGHPPSLISLRCPHEERLGPAQVDLSLRWAHRSFCWFCHAQAQYKF